jgi:GDPmannose 4,6-dehydratase
VKAIPGVEDKVKPGDVIVRVDPKFYRPAEVETLLGNPAKAKRVLGWKPEVTFEGLVREMAASDLKLAQSEHMLRKSGYAGVKSC